jgi:predicted DNA-binding ribbon-helix-helix protein
MEKRSVSLAGHRTSIALEPEFWSALEALAKRRGRTWSALVAEIDRARTPTRNLASAIRVTILQSLTEGSVDAVTGD